MFFVRGKELRFTRHAYDGLCAEDLDEFEIEEMLDVAIGSHESKEKLDLFIGRGRREIIIRVRQGEHAFEVLSVSARSR